jgi:hypothetical protein
MSTELVVWQAQEVEVVEEQITEARPIDQAIEFIEEIGLDLEEALNYIRQYQRALHMFAIPDPNGHGPQLLLQKYNMHHKPGSIAKSKVEQLKAGNVRSLPA